MAEVVAERPEGGITRRELFIRIGFWASAALASGEIGAVILAFFWPKIKPGAFGGIFEIGNLEEILDRLSVGAVPAAEWVGTGRFYLSHVEQGLLALYRKCVHLGCVVPWNLGEDQFHCPCHNSQYDRYGEWVAGPAPRSLDIFPIQLDANGKLRVNTGRIVQRSQKLTPEINSTTIFDPSQPSPTDWVPG